MSDLRRKSSEECSGAVSSKKARERKMRFLAAALAIIVIALQSGCSKHSPTIEGYRIISYDSKTGQWIIIRNGTFDGEYRVKRLTVVCEFYKWGENEPVLGPHACSLQVGKMIIRNSLMGGKGKNFVDVEDSSPDWMAITEGDGPDRVSQHFRILKQELLTPTPK